jgi:hypothetical protein
MLLRGLRCPCSPAQVLPLTHYEDGCTYKHGKPPMPLKYLRRILMGLENDAEHAQGKLTATRVMACPREVLLADYVPCVVDLRSFHKMTIGTAVHEYIGNGTVRWLGRLFGVDISGKPDDIMDGIDDYKFQGDASYRYGLKEEMRVQVSIYRLLAMQQPEWQKHPELLERLTSRLGIWRGSMTSDRDKEPWEYHPVQPMTEEEIAAFKPHRGAYSVQQIVEMHVDFHRMVKEGKTVKEAIGALPLVGKYFQFGKTPGLKCRSYCAVNGECAEVEGKVNV